MKNGTIIILILLIGLLTMAGFSSADNNQSKLYHDYLNEKISDRTRCALIYSRCLNPRSLELMENSALQAIFYQKNKAELVKVMLENHIGETPCKIDYFLIKQYKNWQQYDRIRWAMQD